MAVYPEGIPGVKKFDFRQRFDLNTGKLYIDLSPSEFTNPALINKVLAKVKTPKNIIDLGQIFNAATYAQTYAMDIPKVQGIYVWGMYTVTLTLYMTGYDNNAFQVYKDFNLCAIDRDDAFKNTGTGTLQLQVDCLRGQLAVRGLCGYSYMGHTPYQETYNMTRYYPPEAELMPQKNIAFVPFVVEAYVGLNTVKGYNISQYDFGDNKFVTARIEAQAKKNIRCGADFETIFCGMEAKLDQLMDCNADSVTYNQSFGEINALLWTVTLGVQEGKDVEKYIERLEDLLGVDCTCLACNGERVGPAFVPLCPQVTNAQATLSSNNNIALTFNSANMDTADHLRIAWRDYCMNQNGAWTQVTPDTPLTGGNQLVNIGVPDRSVYQLMLTTVLADGTECDSFIIDTGNWGDCPQLV